MTWALDKHITGLRGSLTALAPLSALTWLKVGGPADWLFCPRDEEDLRHFLIQCPRDMPLTFLGAGSNMLVRDGGIGGTVIHLTPHLNAHSHVGTHITAQAGCSDAVLARYAAAQGLSGLEFMVTIPGTIGGGLIMNAGCYGKEFKDVLICAEGFDREGKRFCVKPDEIGMGYRHSAVPPDWIFTSAVFATDFDDQPAIRARMKAMLTSRAETQPIGARTGGSTFANPDNGPADGKAWQAIEAAGCRDMRKGGASLSPKHCNFLINDGTATAAELEGLGEEVRTAVARHAGVDLRWEIKRIGRKNKGNAGGDHV